MAHKAVCKPFTKKEVDMRKIKFSNTYVLIQELEIPEEKYFKETTDDISVLLTFWRSWILIMMRKMEMMMMKKAKQPIWLKKRHWTT